MKKARLHLLHDLYIILLSIVFAIFLAKTGIAEVFITSLDSLSWLGVFIAGTFFTSVFTTAPAMVVLGTFAHTTPLPLLVVIGGIGATIGDYIIFHFVKDRMGADLTYLLSAAKGKRLKVIFETHLFKFFVPLLGALIIASPLPDEMGIAMLGLSRMNDRIFLPISFLSNALGILIIALVAQAI
jgi:hypothetical protein